MAPAREPIRPDRIRVIGSGGFAFFPNRFLLDGFLASLDHDELRLYVFLVLAANRSGLSYYHYDRICTILEMALDDYVEARNGLIARDLIAFDGSRFQVLELPRQPNPRPTGAPRDAPTSQAPAPLPAPLQAPAARPDAAAHCRAILESLKR